MTHPYPPTPPDRIVGLGPTIRRGPGKAGLVTLIPAAFLPPPHDPLPAKPWLFEPGRDETWWAVPWLVLPRRERVAAEFGQLAIPAGERAPDAREPDAFACLWAALLDCSTNFNGPRLGKAAWHQVENSERFKMALEMYPLVPRLRYDACVRLEPKSIGPASLARAFGRLRAMVAMCDLEDESDPYWVERISTFADFERAQAAMTKQVTDGKWPRRERAFAKAFGGA